MSETHNKYNELARRLHPEDRVAIMAIGNTMRGDDGAGPKVIALIRPRKDLLLLDCGPVPENFLGTVCEFNPSYIVLVDAAMMDAPPGTVRVLGPGDIKRLPALSTHTIPLPLLVDYLQREVVDCQVLLIGIQPKTIAFAEGVSKEVSEAIKEVAHMLNDLLGQRSY